MIGMDISVTPNYSYIFDFENDFIHQRTRKWMVENWTWVFYYCGIYMLVIFGGQHFMQNRPRFQLRGLLIIWNTLLAMFSLMGASRTAPELIHVLRHYGLFHSVCVPSYIEQDRVCGFWTWLFVLSKLPELGDTIFIVLRKQPLIFLHWYHHITVLIYSWFSYTEYTSSARWFIVMNYCVHSMMYAYYALKAARFNPPRFIAMVITTLQLTQMIVGCAINVWAHGFLKTHGRQSCNISQTNINLSIAMYFSYFVLFARFFYKTYLSTDGKKTRRLNNAPTTPTFTTTASTSTSLSSSLSSSSSSSSLLTMNKLNASSNIKKNMIGSSAAVVGDGVFNRTSRANNNNTSNDASGAGGDTNVVNTTINGIAPTMKAKAQ